MAKKQNAKPADAKKGDAPQMTTVVQPEKQDPARAPREPAEAKLRRAERAQAEDAPDKDRKLGLATRARWGSGPSIKELNDDAKAVEEQKE